MHRDRLAHSLIILTGASFVLTGCPRDLVLEPAPDPSSVVVAQFDPTNAIPVLQLVPSPTALAQNPDGSINAETVAPEACEGPDIAQCLQFSPGWPLTTPITLYFSGAIDESSIADGIRVFEQQSDMSLTEVTFAVTSSAGTPRSPPPEACQSGDNGSMPAQTYGAADIPPGIEVTLAITSSTGVQPGRNYFVLVESTEGGGVRAADGSRIEPSDLFSLMNVDSTNGTPVDEDGTINSALLRSNVQGLVLARNFGGRSASELTGEELTQFQAAVQATGQTLFGLYQFFAFGTGTLLANQVLAARGDAVFVNWWTAGASPTIIEFDAGAGVFPFPNVQLLTAPTSSVGGDLGVAFPPGSLPEAIRQGMNTLDGFGTTAPMLVTASANLDPASLDGNVVMYPVTDQNAVDGPAVDLDVEVLDQAEGRPAMIVIRPVRPLLPDTNYVVALTSGILDANGRAVGASAQFRLLAFPEPFIDDQGTVNPAVYPTLECSQAAATGQLLQMSEVVGAATQLEELVQHQRWLEAFAALQTLSPAIPINDVLMTFNYKTQSITTTIDAVKNQLLPGVWAPGQIIGPVASVQGADAIADGLLMITENFCLPFCAQGAMTLLPPIIQPNECQARADEVAAHPVCGIVRNLYTSDLGAAELYLMRTYVATTGNPYVAGTFTPGTVGNPALVDIPMWVITPTTATPGPYPTAILQHGLGRTKEDFFLAANSFAQAGRASVMIDLPFHGDRANDLVDNATGAPCPAVDPLMVDCSDPMDCQNGCDGLQDPSGTGIFSTNLFSVRDNFRQGTIDQLALLRTVQQEGQAGGALANLDGTQVGYLGQSLGGITGGSFAAYANELDAAVLNVPGGSLTTILLNTVPTISAPLFVGLAAQGQCDFVNPANPAEGCKDTYAFRQFITLAQWILDPGDPAATTIGTTTQLPNRPPPLGADRVLIQMSRPDPVVANAAALRLGQALGFALDDTTDPFTSNDDHFQVYDFSALPQAEVGSGCHGFILAPTCGTDLINIICNTFGAQAQAAGFIDSGGTNVPPQTPATIAGQSCE